jgi:hypothetical protein
MSPLATTHQAVDHLPDRRPSSCPGTVASLALEDAVDSVAAVSWGRDRIDLFWVDAERALWHRSFAGSWSAAESLGGRLASPPAVTAWREDQLEVFAIFDDGALWDRYWDGESWHEWESLGGSLTGLPTASSWGDDRLDVFAPGIDGRIWHRWWDGERWVDWEQLSTS